MVKSITSSRKKRPVQTGSTNGSISAEIYRDENGEIVLSNEFIQQEAEIDKTSEILDNLIQMNTELMNEITGLKNQIKLLSMSIEKLETEKNDLLKQNQSTVCRRPTLIERYEIDKRRTAFSCHAAIKVR